MSAQKALTQFLDAKMRTWFRMNNLKRDGFVGKSDLKENAEMFIKEFNLTGKKAKDLENWLVNGWNIVVLEGAKMAKSGNLNGITSENAAMLFQVNNLLEKGERISEDQYVAAFGDLINADMNLFIKIFGDMVETFFETFDSDHDGLITADDMVRGWKCFGVEQDEAVRNIFTSMDKDKSGLVNKRSYVEQWVEFVTGNNHDAPIARFLCGK